MEGKESDVKELLKACADVCEHDSEKISPHMHAAKNGHTSVVSKLLEARAPWNAVNNAHQSSTKKKRGLCAHIFFMWRTKRVDEE